MGAKSAFVRFNATEGGGAATPRPWKMLRLSMQKTAKARPGAGFKVAGAKEVRGAWEVAPAETGRGTAVKLSWS